MKTKLYKKLKARVQTFNNPFYHDMKFINVPLTKDELNTLITLIE